MSLVQAQNTQTDRSGQQRAVGESDRHADLSDRDSSDNGLLSSDEEEAISRGIDASLESCSKPRRCFLVTLVCTPTSFVRFRSFESFPRRLVLPFPNSAGPRGGMHFAEFIAGWISGAVGLVVGHPMDTIKVRLQTQLKYRGIIDCMIKIYKHERIPGFFKGMSFPVLSVAVGNAVVFSSYSNALEFISQSQRSDRSSSPSSVEIFVAGCFSGAAQVLVMAPVDLVKVRLQNQSHPHRSVSWGGAGGPQYRGPVHCVASILRQEGVPGLYRGVGALALRDIPCYGLYFLPYELLCRTLTEEGQQPGTATVLVAGGCAGVVTWSCATPMDVVKARLQMEGVQGQRYGGVLACVRESVRAEGGAVLFKGLLANSIRAFPVNAVTFLTYESLLRGMQ